MQIIPLFLFFIGSVLLVSGFKKNNRVLMAVAAFVWLTSGAWGEFSQGFKDGISADAKPTSATRPNRRNSDFGPKLPLAI